VLIAIRTSRKVTDVPRQIQLGIVRLNRVRIDRHVLSGLSLEPDYFRATGPAPDDAAFVGLVRGFLEAHA